MQAEPLGYLVSGVVIGMGGSGNRIARRIRKVVVTNPSTLHPQNQDKTMNIKLIATIVAASALMLPISGYTADTDANRTSPKTFVKDSVITAKIKAELAEEKVSSLVRISVDTTDKGAVTLSGNAKSQAAADKAVSIARAVKGVTSVESSIKIVADK